MHPFFSKIKNKRLPFVGLALAAIVGILFEEFINVPSAWLVGLASLIGIGFLIKVLFFSNKQKRMSWEVLFFVTICFALLHAWQWQEAPAHRIATLLESGSNDLCMEGIVSSEVKFSKNGNASFFLKTKKIITDIEEIVLPVTLLVHWEGAHPAYGDLVRLQGTVHAPLPARNPGEFDYVTWLARKEIWMELKMDPSNPGVIVSSGDGFFLIRWAIALHHWVEETLQLGLTGDPSVVSVLKGLTLGVTEGAPEGLTDDFKLTGTLHLFAVSGLHVGMVAMIIWFLLKVIRLPQQAAVLVIIPALFFYAMMTGLRIGSLRAALMASIILGGFLIYRRPQMINSLAAAAFLLLAVETNLLFSQGWQFSFSVVLAILLLAPPLQKYFERYYQYDPFLPKKLITPVQKNLHHLFQHVAQLMSVSIAAWIGALLPCAFYFHLISISALGVNVLVVPLAFLIFSIASLSLLSNLFSSWVAIVFNNANWLFVKLLLLIIHGFTLLPLSSFAIRLPGPGYPVVTLFDIPSAQILVLQTEGKTWLINTGRAFNTKKTIIPFFEAEGIRNLQGLLLTGKDAVHLGGAMELVGHYTPQRIIVASGTTKSLSFLHLVEGLEASHQVMERLYEGEHFFFSSNCWVEVFYLPLQAHHEGDCSASYNAVRGEEASILKLHLGETTVLILPKITDALICWLRSHCNQELLHVTVLVFASHVTNLAFDDKILETIAPQWAIFPNDSPVSHGVSTDELKRFFKEHGNVVIDQEQVGAVTIQALPHETSVRGFLK